MSSAALRSARSDAASGGSRFRNHVNHPDYEVLAYIDGDFQPASADWIPVLDKAAGVPFGRYTNCSDEQVDQAVAAARRAQPDWAATSSTTRQTILRAFAMELELRRDDARYGGEGQQRAFTRRQWIGVQTTDVPYPAWAESQSPDQ